MQFFIDKTIGTNYILECEYPVYLALAFGFFPSISQESKSHFSKHLHVKCIGLQPFKFVKLPYKFLFFCLFLKKAGPIFLNIDTINPTVCNRSNSWNCLISTWNFCVPSKSQTSFFVSCTKRGNHESLHSDGNGKIVSTRAFSLASGIERRVQVFQVRLQIRSSRSLESPSRTQTELVESRIERLKC